jgi:hypothetical protein
MVCSSFLVEVEKVTPAKMEEWKKLYPNNWKREYNPAEVVPKNRTGC